MRRATPRRPSSTRPAGWRRELQFFLATYVIYDAARWLFAGDASKARADARCIIELERSTHVAIEGAVQRALDFGAASWLLSNVYLAAQLVVMPLALVWLYRRSRPLYRRLRDAIIATWLITVPIFALFPVAPPRLAGIGIADTVSGHAAVALTGRSTLLYNQYAAVPSLHVGFAFALGLSVAAALRRPWAKAVALLWAPTVALSVLATDNHYVFDIAAGLVVTGAGFACAQLYRRLAPPAVALASGPVAPPAVDRHEDRPHSCATSPVTGRRVCGASRGAETG